MRFGPVCGYRWDCTARFCLFLIPEGWLLAHVFDALPFNYE
jgi:hypothetical protein